MSDSLLLTKLYFPPPGSNLVLRPRLVEQLNKGLSSGRKLTLISAPAGFGKTTLVSKWFAGPSDCPPNRICGNFDSKQGEQCRVDITCRQILWIIQNKIGATRSRICKSIMADDAVLPTKRTLDARDSAQFPSNFLALRFSSSQTESITPHPQVIQTVGRPPLVWLDSLGFWESMITIWVGLHNFAKQQKTVVIQFPFSKKSRTDLYP